MIHSLKIYNFGKALVRNIEFHAGLNILEARQHKKKESGSRNGVGKTSLLKVIRFCLGAELDSERTMKSARNVKLKERLAGWTFELDLTIGDWRIAARRTVGLAKKDDHVLVNIVKEGADTTFLTGTQEVDFDFDNPTIMTRVSIDNWKHFLARRFFGARERFVFNELSSYFLRRLYNDALLPVRGVTETAARTNLAFLLGLNWKLMIRFAELIEQDKKPRRVIQVFKDYLKEHHTSENLLRNDVDYLRHRIDSLKNQLNALQVQDAAEQENANFVSATEELQSVNCELARLRYRRAAVEADINSKLAPASSVQEVYGELQKVFKPDALLEYESLKNFSDILGEKWDDLLQKELDEIDARIERLEARRDVLKISEDASYKTLNAKGVLEKFASLSDQVTKLSIEAEIKQARLDEYSAAVREHAQILDSRDALIKDLEKCRGKEEPTIREIERLFTNTIAALYSDGRDASLTIGLAEKKVSLQGYTYEPYANKAGSEGIDKMIIFAFDWMLLQRQQDLGSAIDFIVHDSLIFDHTDERQVGAAFKRIIELSAAGDYQYICALNSDTLDKPGIRQVVPNLSDYYLDEYLDDTPEGSLFREDF